MANDWFVWPGKYMHQRVCNSRNWKVFWFFMPQFCKMLKPQIENLFFHSLFSGRRRVSLSRNTQLKHFPNSASSHYFSICKLNLAIPIILLLLSTTFDVTGEWFEFSFSSGFLISQTNISSIVNLLLFSKRIRNIPSFIKHFDHISVAVCLEREELSSCRVNNRNKSKK